MATGTSLGLIKSSLLERYDQLKLHAIPRAHPGRSFVGPRLVEIVRRSDLLIRLARLGRLSEEIETRYRQATLRLQIGPA